MAAHLVHHNHHTFTAAFCRKRLNTLLKFMQHDFIKTLAVFAQGGVFQFFCEGLRHAFTDAFATRLIVNPKDCKAGMIQNIDQAFVIVFSPLKCLFA